MKILIAGYGSIGRRHMRNLIALGEKDIILYRTHKSTLPEDEISGFPVVTNLDTALDHKPDAVIISNPTALHLETAIPAARAGCHILMEKPISHTLEGTADLASALKESGKCLLSAFQFRFHPGMQKIRQLLSENKIGDVTAVRAHWGEYLPNWHPWEDYRKSYSARADMGGGVVHTLCHPLDYLRYLLGEIDWIWGVTSQSNYLSIDVEDTAEIGMQFRNGVTGSVHLDYLQQPAEHTLKIIGTRGTILWDNNDGKVRRFNADSTTWVEYFPPQGFERNQLFLAELRHFLAIIRGEAVPVCTLEDGIAALKIALAVHRSAKSGSREKIE